jgi:thiamine biosynthesis lipoprotein
MVTAAPAFAVRFGAMASDCEIMLAAASEADARRLAGPAMAEVRRIETKYSRYRTDSVVGQINANAGAGWTVLDPETEALLAYAGTLHQASGGLFDATSGVLRRAWNFRGTRCPTQAELEPVLALIGWELLEHAPGRARLARAGMELDFGGFGKEYAADRACAALQAAGVRHGYVNLGGDVRAVGPQPDGTPWEIGIQDPRGAGTVAGIALAGGALATSGDYERFIEVDGQRHCHVLDPRTGRSVSHWRSVSVVAPLAVAAGSHATIAMLKGPAALSYLDATGCPYLAIDHTGAMFRRDA